jgi:hypothetical protein
MRKRHMVMAAVALTFALSLASPALAQDETTPGTEPVSKYIKRAVFATGMTEREPDDQITELTTDILKVFFFTEIVDMEGRKVTHRWSYKGETQAELNFVVGGPRWRVYSSKNLLPGWTGTWMVEVVDDAGTVLTTQSFAYKDIP